MLAGKRELCFESIPCAETREERHVRSAPEVENVLDFFRAAAAAAAAASNSQQLNKVAWNKACEKCSLDRRWAHVKGPISSAFATLIDFNRQHEHYNRWIDPSGNTWFTDYSQPNLVTMAKRS